MRMEACREELNILLEEERLAGATLLVLANKQDLPGALSAQEIKDVSHYRSISIIKFKIFLFDRFFNLTRSQHIIGQCRALAQSLVINC